MLKPLSLYETYENNKVVCEKSEYFIKYRFDYADQTIVVCISKKTAGKRTRIHCKENGTVFWEQLYPFGGHGRPFKKTHPLGHFSPEEGTNEWIFVVIKGMPDMISGLDEGIVCSSRSTKRSCRNVFVMTEEEFKLFSIP